MTHDDDLDLMLGGEPEIVPGPAFTASVMKAVHEAAFVPPPIPFPWKRALPGLAVGGVALLIALALAPGSASGSSPAQLERWLSALAVLLRSLAAGGGGWVLVALAMTYLSLKLSMRLARPGFVGR